MTTDRIKEIQSKTAYSDSISVQQALLQVWNECEQERLRIADVVERSEQLKDFINFCSDNYSLEIPDRIIEGYKQSL